MSHFDGALRSGSKWHDIQSVDKGQTFCQISSRGSQWEHGSSRARKTQQTRSFRAFGCCSGKPSSVCPRCPRKRAAARPVSDGFSDWMLFALAVKPPCLHLCEGGGEDACGDIMSVALRRGRVARRKNQSSEPSHKQTQRVRLLFCWALATIIQHWRQCPAQPKYNRPISSPSE